MRFYTKTHTHYCGIDLHAKTTSEVRYIPADRPAARLRIVRKRQRNVEYHVDHGGDFFYILHNRGAVNFKLSRIRLGAPPDTRWTTLVPHRRKVLLEDFDVFERTSFMFFGYRVLSQDYDKDGFKWDIVTHGPMFGVEIPF